MGGFFCTHARAALSSELANFSFTCGGKSGSPLSVYSLSVALVRARADLPRPLFKSAACWEFFFFFKPTFSEGASRDLFKQRGSGGRRRRLRQQQWFWFCAGQQMMEARRDVPSYHCWVFPAQRQREGWQWSRFRPPPPPPPFAPLSPPPPPPLFPSFPGPEI